MWPQPDCCRASLRRCHCVSARFGSWDSFRRVRVKVGCIGQLQLKRCNKESANPYCQRRLGFFRHLAASTRRTSSAWFGNSRRLVQLRQLSKQFAGASARPFKSSNFIWRRIALLIKLRLQSNQAAQFCTDLHFVGYIHDATSVQARSQVCHPGVGSLWRSRLNNSSRPCICE